ncbi:uncharacterized protein RAG0_04277 [Rhynchosporium agropyri]|uniref:CENP-V/GFA domain-containing protein n=1 Tax=Rhynchosporium agropyri TaxID=914238 RepID=A0A1E1K807_9HELO|nr:uncharacterized protein RAG0_04277 [Rhynchosporium agropyri]
MAPSTTEKATAQSHTGCADHELEGEHNEWKFRAPYKVHENVSNSSSSPKDIEMTSADDKKGSGANGEKEGGDGGFRAIYEGGCHCGKVKYQLSREAPVKSKFCHCSTCQRLHGAPLQHAAIFHKEDINFLKGHHDLQWYDSQEKTTRHKLPCKVSCAHCGSWIMDEGRSMILLFPGLLELSEEAKEKFKPTLHMFYANRVVDINDGLPKWAGMQDDSELIADTPAEDIKKRKREVDEKEREERAKKRHGDEDDEAGKDGNNGKKDEKKD